MKNNILYIAFICFLLFGELVQAQQAVQYTQHFLNKYEMNSAYAGFDYSLSVTGHYRNQWAGFESRPLSQNVNVHMPLYIINGGIGMSIRNDKIGPIGSTTGSLSYNYVYQSDVGLFSFGANLGFHQMRIDGSELRTSTGLYEGGIIEHQDPILFNGQSTGFGPSYGIAAYFKERFLQAGVSITNFPSNRISIGDISYKRQNLYNVFVEYKLAIMDNITLTPSIFFKTDLVQTQGEVFGFVSYEQRYFGGIGLRGYSGNTIDALTLTAGLQLSKHYKVSYSYDLGISGFKNNHEGTHEFILNYNLAKAIGIGLPPKIIYNPRYLDK